MTVIMVVPAGGSRDSTALSDVVSTVNGQVADFWAEQSDGGVVLGVTSSRDWVDLGVGCDDPWALWSAAAHAAGFIGQPGDAQHLLVYVGNGAGCSDGLGTVGNAVSSGGYSYVRYPTTSVIAHELGHNLGLGHSSLLQCDGAVSSGTCATTPYYDLYDVMGASWGPLGSLNVPQARERISHVSTMSMWLNSSPENAQEIPLVPVSSRDAGTRGIELSDGGEEHYWLEYRPAAGRDAWLGTAVNRYGLQSGVQLRRESNDGDSSLLLDATPSPRAGWSRDLSTALPVGTTVRLDGRRGAGVFEITVTGSTASVATVRIVPKSAVTVAFERSGGTAGPMGAPMTTEQMCGQMGSTSFCERRFTNGSIVWTPTVDGGAHLVHGPVYTAWSSGGGASVFGFPTTDTTCGGPGAGCRQGFVSANLYSSPATGTKPVRGALRVAYVSLGEEAGVLGYPTDVEICVGSGSCRQDFQFGTLVTGVPGGPRLVPSDFRAVWSLQGYEAGPLGQPTSGAICGLRDGGCGQVFEGGRVYSSPGNGAHAVSGVIQEAWIAQGWEAGPLGYPLAGQVCGLAGGGCAQVFQGGRIYWHPQIGARPVIAPVERAWRGAGGESGVMGYPRSGLICGLRDGGCGQVFQGGRVYSSAAGTFAVSGAVQAAWIAQGWERGPLGYPTGDQRCGLAGDACMQAFQVGTLVARPGMVTVAVTGAVAATWRAAGGETGALGLPASGLICGLRDGGCGQVFDGGRVYSSAAGTFAVSGAVQAAWIAQGWEAGPLGYPASGLICGLRDG
ncbi:hypothetical protein DQ237_18055, partial [Blastococcus sp. TF02-8]